MSGKDRQVKSIVLLEGHVRWIMERETPEERLAAWETLASIAFPENQYELPYKPPQKPFDGSRLSPCDRARRDTYNMLADFINSRMWERNVDRKNPKKVLAGRLGAAIRHGMSDRTVGDSAIEVSEDVKEEHTEANATPPPFVTNHSDHITMTPLDARAEEIDLVYSGFRKRSIKLSDYDKQKIEEWNKKIPNASALREWLDRNYFMPNKNLVCSEQFCSFAYQKIAKEGNWISYKDNHVVKNLLTVIHWMAIDFQRKTGEIKRAEEEEKRKDIEAEFETKTKIASQKSDEDIAVIQRISSRKAERAAMEKILKGEL